MNYDLPEYQGDEDFIVERKCEAAFERLGRAVLVEDTSLSVDCLAGLPGPYVKWFLDRLGPDGLVKMTQAWTDKSATIRCLLGYIDGGDVDTPGKAGKSARFRVFKVADRPALAPSRSPAPG